MADALRQKASEAYLDDDFESAITYFTQASLTPPFSRLLQVTIVERISRDSRHVVR